MWHLLELLYEYNGLLLLLVTVTEHTGIHPADQSVDSKIQAEDGPIPPGGVHVNYSHYPQVLI